MPSLSPNALVRRAWQQAQTVTQRDEERRVTQQEFLDVSFGVNPRTGKPYNPRTLRKWLANERDASNAVTHSVKDTYSFQQFVSVGDQTYGITLTKPSKRSGLDLWKPSRRKAIRDTARKRLETRATENISNQRSPTETRVHRDRTSGQTTIEVYRPVRSTRGLKLAKARAVSKQRQGQIITTRERKAA